MQEETSLGAPATRDYFAELYVAGLFGDAGWAVYFPKRDVGFDFVATKQVGFEMLLRPVQVKGRYPQAGRKNGNVGFIGTLSAVHPDMVLAVAFFDAHERGRSPSEVAFLPFSGLSRPIGGGYRTLPAKLSDDRVQPRESYRGFFGDAGLRAIERPDWGRTAVSVEGAVLVD